MLHWIDLLDLVDVVPSTRRGWKRLGWLMLAASVCGVLCLFWNFAVAAFS